MKLLVITPYYPPVNTIASRRWGNLVKTLLNNGVDCTILTEGQTNTGMGMHREKVHYWTSSENKNKSTAKAKPIKRTSLIKKIILFLTPPIIIDYLTSWKKIKLIKKNIKIKEFADIDFIIASYGPLIPLVLGIWLSRKIRKPLIIDIRDSFEFRDSTSFIVAKYISRVIERYLLNKGSERVTVGKSLSTHLANTYGCSFKAVYSGWSDDDAIDKSNQKQMSDGYLYYAGSIYEHRLPALALVLSVLKDYPQIRLKMRIAENYSNVQLASFINKHQGSVHVEVLEKAPSKIINLETSQCIGILLLEALYDDGVTDHIIPGKLFELLGSGVPGIAISSTKGEISHILKQIGGLYHASSREKLDRVIKLLLYEGKKPLAINKLNEYHINEQAKKIIAILNKNYFTKF